MDRDSVFEDLEELGAVGGADPAEPEADERGCLFGVEETGCHRERLAIVVRLDFGEGVEVDHGGALSCEDVLSFDSLRERVLDDAIVLGFAVDRESFQGFHGLGLSIKTAGEKRDADCKSGDWRKTVHGG